MSPTSSTLLAACGLATLTVSGFLLRQACSLWRIELPSYRRAFFCVLLVGSAAYLVFDGGGYLLMRLTAGGGIILADDYGYRDWLVESPALKWQAMGLVPWTRYLIAVLALGAAGTLQTLTLGTAATTFRISPLIFLTQWALNAGAFLLLWCLLSVCLGSPEGAGNPSKEGSAAVEGRRRLVLRPRAYAEGESALVPQPAPRGEDEVLEGKGAAEQASGWDGYLGSVKRSSAPVTRRLPRPVQQFLNQGGWWLLIAVLGVLSVFWLESFVRRVRTGLAAPGCAWRKRQEPATPRIRLADLPAPPAGPRRLTVKGLPACLRLIVIAPGGTSAPRRLGSYFKKKILDGIKHGLGEMARRDRPRILTWKAQYSSAGFSQAFHHACSPGGSQGPSPWVCVAGAITVGRQRFFVGLALLADEPNNLSAITVVHEQWLDVLGAREREGREV